MKKTDVKEKLSYFTPRGYVEFLRKQMNYAGMKGELAGRLIGFSLFFSIFLSLVIVFDLLVLGWETLGIVIGIAAGIVSIVSIHTFIILLADSRAAEIEKILPDALQLMSANVRAGMTVDKAIWLSARPEFGILEEEIKRVGAKTVGGKSVKVALTEMAERIKSDILEKTVKLIIEGMESGGELAHLLEEIANNVRVTQSLRKEIKASVMTYSIFILFAAVLGAPMLFAISVFFVDVMTKLWSPSLLGGIESTSGGVSGPGGFLAKATGPQVTVDQLFWFAIASLTLTTFFGSLIIGLIQTGREKNGLKFIPLLVTGAIGIFLLARFIIEMLFGGLFVI